MIIRSETCIKTYMYAHSQYTGLAEQGLIHVKDIVLVSSPFMLDLSSLKTQNSVLADFLQGTRRCCDAVSTSFTLIQRHHKVVCPVG